jgi:hypothetical protein
MQRMTATGQDETGTNTRMEKKSDARERGPESRGQFALPARLCKFIHRLAYLTAASHT